MLFLFDYYIEKYRILFLNVSANIYSVWIYVFGRVRAVCFMVALAVFYRIIG